MNDLIKSIALGVVRNAALAFGGWLLAKGYVDSSTATGVEGSICCLISAGFSVYDKFKVDAQVKSSAAVKGK